MLPAPDQRRDLWRLICCKPLRQPPLPRAHVTAACSSLAHCRALRACLSSKLGKGRDQGRVAAWARRLLLQPWNHRAAAQKERRGAGERVRRPAWQLVYS